MLRCPMDYAMALSIDIILLWTIYMPYFRGEGNCISFLIPIPCSHYVIWKKYTVLLMSCLIAVRSISSTKQKDEAEVKKEIQSVIRQITASVTFLPLIECPCMWLLLCFEITISTILTSTVGNTCLILQLLRLTRWKWYHVTRHA